VSWVDGKWSEGRAICRTSMVTVSTSVWAYMWWVLGSKKHGVKSWAHGTALSEELVRLASASSVQCRTGVWLVMLNSWAHSTEFNACKTCVCDSEIDWEAVIHRGTVSLCIPHDQGLSIVTLAAIMVKLVCNKIDPKLNPHETIVSVTRSFPCYRNKWLSYRTHVSYNKNEK
jgi:hypothetical protein